MRDIDLDQVKEWFKDNRFLTTDELVKRLSLGFPSDHRN
jgi:hypothetical protein